MTTAQTTLRTPQAEYTRGELLRRIRCCFKAGRVGYTRHARERMAERAISEREVLKVGRTAEWQYQRARTVLLRGRCRGRVIGLVVECRVRDDQVLLVTVFDEGKGPAPGRWRVVRRRRGKHPILASRGEIKATAKPAKA